MMAAGLVVVAHNSGGPRDDIICVEEGHRTGYLAATPEEYADAVMAAFAEVEEEERRFEGKPLNGKEGDSKVGDDFEFVDLPTVLS